MARKLGKRDNRHLARLVTGERAPCAFCLREVDDELTYGKLYAIGDIQVHYYCCLLSCCLIQKGSDEEGLFGFMYSDILAEQERCKKHKCSYCGRAGANLGCCVGACRKQFHLPCGRERHAVSQYFGSYKSFCQQHAPRQKIPDHIMAKARLRARGVKPLSETDSEDSVCLICYEEVDAFPTVHTFWPPCCGKDAWFHRKCLQRMSLSAGMYYLKCPLCNDKESFYKAVIHQGYYVPDRDAAWELEQNAFAEIYERPASCSVELCLCPMGREHDAEHGCWDIKLCLLCGSSGAHALCIQSQSSKPHEASVDQSQTRFVCKCCLPAAPADLTQLVACIEAIIQSEQSAAAAAAASVGPRMPARMSIRRTKPTSRPTTSRTNVNITQHVSTDSRNITRSRQELNLAPPRRREAGDTTLADREGSVLVSPANLLEQGLRDKMLCSGVTECVVAECVHTCQDRLRRPGPMCHKLRVVNDIVRDVLSNTNTQVQHKEGLTPNKLYNTSQDNHNVDTPKRQESFDKENLRTMNTPNKSPRNFKTDTRFGVKSTDDSLYFNVENNTNVDKYNECQEKVESYENVNERMGTGELQNNTATKDSGTEISNEHLNVTKNNSNCTKSDSNDNKKETESSNNNTESKNDLNSSENETKDTKCDPTGNINYSNDTKNDTDPKETPIRPVKPRKCKTESPKTSSNKIILHKRRSSRFDTNDVRKFKKLSLKRSVENKKDYIYILGDSKLSIERLDTNSKELDIPSRDLAKNSKDCDITLKNLESHAVESALTTKIDDATIDSIIIDTLKSKTIDIQADSSLEISENDQHVNINVIKIEDSPTAKESYQKLQSVSSGTPKSPYKFYLIENEKSLKKKDFIDLENFKKVYLTEVGKEFVCNYKHNHENNLTEERKFKSPIDFALDAVGETNSTDAVKKAKKRKLFEGGVILTAGDDEVKKRKSSESDLNFFNEDETKEKSNDHNKVDTSKTNKRKHKTKDRKKKKIKKRKSENKNIEVTINSEKRSSKKREKIKTKLAIKNQNISLKIRLKKGSNSRVSLNIESKNESRKTKKNGQKIKKNNNSKFIQYKLQFPEGSSKEVIVKPEKEICPLIRKYVKQEKSPDKMKQTSIQSFFKIKSEK